MQDVDILNAHTRAPVERIHVNHRTGPDLPFVLIGQQGPSEIYHSQKTTSSEGIVLGFDEDPRSYAVVQCERI